MINMHVYYNNYKVNIPSANLTHTLITITA